jgi:hypothetical protein
MFERTPQEFSGGEVRARSPPERPLPQIPGGRGMLRSYGLSLHGKSSAGTLAVLPERRAGSLGYESMDNPGSQNRSAQQRRAGPRGEDRPSIGSTRCATPHLPLPCKESRRYGLGTSRTTGVAGSHPDAPSTGKGGLKTTSGCGSSLVYSVLALPLLPVPRPPALAALSQAALLSSDSAARILVSTPFARGPAFLPASTCLSVRLTAF